MVTLEKKNSKISNYIALTAINRSPLKWHGRARWHDAAMPLPCPVPSCFFSVARPRCSTWGHHATSLGLNNLLFSSKPAFLAFFSRDISGFSLFLSTELLKSIKAYHIRKFGVRRPIQPLYFEVQPRNCRKDMLKLSLKEVNWRFINSPMLISCLSPSKIVN